MAPGYFPFEVKDYLYVIMFTLISDGVYIPIWYGLWKAGIIFVVLICLKVKLTLDNFQLLVQ
jgi:hypothetical protein